MTWTRARSILEEHNRAQGVMPMEVLAPGALGAVPRPIVEDIEPQWLVEGNQPPELTRVIPEPLPHENEVCLVR